MRGKQMIDISKNGATVRMDISKGHIYVRFRLRNR